MKTSVLTTGLLSSAVLAQQPEPVTIAIIGDQGNETAENCVMVDGCGAHEVLALILDQGADAIVHLGDFEYLDDPAEWIQQIYSILPNDFPYIAVVGDEEDEGSEGDPTLFYYAMCEKLLDNANLSWVGDAGRKFSVDFEGVRIVLTSPGIDNNGVPEAAAFITGRFDDDAPHWRISGWHHLMPDMHVGNASDSALGGGGWAVYENSRESGAIVATAHEHLYSRTILLSSMEFQTPAGSELIVSEGVEGKTFAVVDGLGGRQRANNTLCPGERACGIWAKIYDDDNGPPPPIDQYGALFMTFNYITDPCLARGEFKTTPINALPNPATQDDFRVTSGVGTCASCRWDITGPNGPDGAVDTNDFLFLLQNCCDPFPLDAYGITDFLDLLNSWGPCP